MGETVVVTGATGHIGTALVRQLRGRGVAVRAVGRSAARLEALVAQGAEARAGSVEDAAFLAAAFAGAGAVFALVPPDLATADLGGHQRRVADALASALQKARVPRAVSLSSVGADLDKGNGPIAGLHGLEKRLEAVPGLHVLHLRPAFFMENHLASIGLIKGQGINGGSLRADLAFAMIATRDIAAVAAEILANPSFTGRSVRELLGPRDYTMVEATRVLGSAVGRRDLPYVAFPYDDARKAMIAVGISPDMARAIVEMHEGFNAGRIRPIQGRRPDTATPTTLEAFAEDTFLPAFRA